MRRRGGICEVDPTSEAELSETEGLVFRFVLCDHYGVTSERGTKVATFNEFDIVIVPFPFTERPIAKRRPAVMVSVSRFNADHTGKVLAMVTTAGARWPSDVALQDWQQAGLHVACWVRFKLFTLDDHLIDRKAGTLSIRDAQAVQAGLRQCLAI